MDFSFLRAEPFELPDPQALAIRGMTLANLSQTNQEGQMKLDALRQAQDVKQAAAKVFGDAQTMGWDAAIKKAAQEGNTLGAAAALQLRRQDEGDAAKIENDRAQANERNSAATKNTMQAKVDGFKQFASITTGMASGMVPVNDATMSAAYETARAILPDNVVRTIPADPARFKEWAATMADPKVQSDIWEKLQTVPAKVNLDNANANRANVEAQYIPQDSNSRRITAGAAASNAATNAGELGLRREQYKNPLMQHASDGQGGLYAFNPKGGAYDAATDSSGNPIPRANKPAPEAYNKQVAGITNLNTAISEYQAALKKWGTGSVLSPDARAEMGTKYNNMMLQAKEAYNLGVLNGPDYQILQSVVADPMSTRGIITSNDALSRQAGELGRIMQKNANNLATVYKQPAPAVASGGQTFNSLPDPAQYPGRRMVDESGAIYRSINGKWVREK